MKRVRDFHSQSWSNPFFGRHSPGRWTGYLRAVGGVLASGGLLYGIVYSPLLRISKISVSEVLGIDKARIEAAAAQPLAGYDYLVVPRDFSPIINRQAVANSILVSFPQLLSADVKKTRNSLAISVIARRETVRMIIGDKSYLLDQQSLGMREAAIGEGDNLVAVEQADAVFAPGKKMLADEWLDAINNLHKYFATHVGIRDQLFRLEPHNDVIKVVTAEGWYAIIDPSVDVISQLKILSSTLASKFNSGQRNKIDYIDVRFGDKIYYKLK